MILILLENHEEKIGLSFKKVKPRPNNIDICRVKIIRKLFAFKLTKLISDKTLVINIDESSLNRRIPTQYTWEFKGIPIESKNSPFISSMSFVMAIWSNGAWISFMMNETININNFLWLLMTLNHWVESFNKFGYDNVLILLDNCSFHKGVYTKSLLRKIG